MMGVMHRPPVHPDVIVSSDCVSSVKVWQPWIRVLHWTLAGTVCVLTVTGLYLANPTVGVLSRWDLMADMRFVHLLAAWVFMVVLVGRVFLAFTGNPWARWDQLVPRSRERRAALVHTVRYYLFLEREPAEVVGHNPLAGLVYLAVFGVLLAQAFVGIALMATGDRMHGWEHALTNWFASDLSLPGLRLAHHLLMWLIWGFVITHIYASTLSDRIERSGEISSMVGGWKQLPTDRVQAELDRDALHRRERFLR
jgi:Ni/Fe-hydrogenase 1 B-type cytochrome subunit